MPDDELLVGHDVVGDVRVNRCGDFRHPGLDIDDEPQQRLAVVGFRESLAGKQLAFLEYPVGVEESVGRHEVHDRTARGTSQELP